MKLPYRRGDYVCAADGHIAVTAPAGDYPLVPENLAAPDPRALPPSYWIPDGKTAAAWPAELPAGEPVRLLPGGWFNSDYLAAIATLPAVEFLVPADPTRPALFRSGNIEGLLMPMAKPGESAEQWTKK